MTAGAAALHTGGPYPAEAGTGEVLLVARSTVVDDGLMPTVAGTALLRIMAQLSRVRPVFHSEADFQQAFAWTVRELDRGVEVRLEVPQDDGEHLDLLCFGPMGRTVIEFKYFTTAWHDPGISRNEVYRLRDHGAADVARHGFVRDIVRVERFCRRATSSTTGLTVMLTNARGLWSQPSRLQPTRDAQFRIHDGQTLTGTLRWGSDPDFHLPNERTLAGSYHLQWHDYSILPGRNGAFRWLGVGVGTSSTDLA